jgi:putative type I restriction endonuclease
VNPYKIWKCSDFLKFFPTNSLSWDQLSYTEQNEFLNLHYGLIHNGAPTLIDCERYQLPYIQINIKNYTLCDDGDVIFADASEDTKDICKPVEFINISKNNVVCGLHTIHARDYQNLTILGYKGYLFSSYNFHKQVHRLTQGTKIFSINSSNFKEMFVGIPEKAEQKEIVLFLAKIDERIDTQSKIIDNLESLIKGIRYIIFSGNHSLYNETYTSKLGNFLDEYTQKNINNNLRSASVGKYGIRMRDEIYSKDLTNDYSKNKVIYKDTLSIGMGSTQIDIGILLEDNIYCISPAYTTYKIQGINSFYLNEYLIYLNPLLSKRYMVIGARQGKSVNKSELMVHEMELHSVIQQLEIVKIFSSIYTKLKKEKDILSLYKKQKAYLLQNMFI